MTDPVEIPAPIHENTEISGPIIANTVSEEVAEASVTSEVTHPYPGLTVHKLKGDIPDSVFVDVPTYFICPNCNFEGNTKVQRAKGPLFTLCVMIPCFWYCCECLDDYEHSCPQCRVVLGSYTDYLD